MAGRTYGQFEGLARGLDLVGERWTLLIVRELLLGPKRYKDLLDGLPGIGTNLLAARLKMLKEQGLVEVKTLPPPAGSAVYDLTDRGRALEEPLIALARWGMQFLEEPAESDVLRPGWGVLAMRATFQPEAARGVRETYELRIGADVFHIDVDDGTMEARQGPASRPDLILETDLETFLAIGAHQLSPVEAVMTGRASVEGDLQAGFRVVEILGLPQPQPAERAREGGPPGWGVLAMRQTFNPLAAAGVFETYELHVDGEVFHLVVNDGSLQTAQGPAADPDLVFKTDSATLMAIGAHQVNPLEAVQAGRADMSGSPDAALRCQRIFGLVH
jgi:DNA-binding HxlR family transcriptional regulator/putative sterol carrier protein